MWATCGVRTLKICEIFLRRSIDVVAEMNEAVTPAFIRRDVFSPATSEEVTGSGPFLCRASLSVGKRRQNTFDAEARICIHILLGNMDTD